MRQFTLDERLERDSELVTVLGLCQLRLMKDRRWPWLVLVPQREGISEIFELTPLDQTLLTFETNAVAAALKKATAARKINVGALGNVVAQLHVHIVARNEGDPNWPGPIWGHGTPEPYENGAENRLLQTLIEAL
ncbi:HIT domain-containing protein [Pseudorhizobium flavum]|uniref:Diadenosine tetraphosphate (Ap4A) HIT family hydrolase n=1 Tax=Pseudorhizobium flavum TaxID=1335061 RepID=A0A7W9Z0H9_9HYPH|nr:HIT family protein [Pseudorhizobium flavum]MBB6180446.1 diadenosine tetraphosphate (Ap4A) HIT family hydrolase [Pseudorhizobium flavum]CAD6595499.1 HIT domain-containing protein [Pseudorhizobium flavum]